MGVRSQLASALRAAAPKSWKIIDSPRNLDTIDRHVVMLKRTRIERLPAAPIGSHMVTFIVTVIEPKTDPVHAEDALEDALDEFLFALDQLTPTVVRWTEATRVVFGDKENPAYDITVEMIASKEQAP